jgi:hypothetical protein
MDKIAEATQQINGTALVAGVLLLGLVTMLGKRELNRILASVERIPEPKWFSDVNEALRRIPSQDSLDDLARELRRISDLSERIAVLTRDTQTLFSKYDSDHVRLGRVEDLAAMSGMRLDILENKR